MSTSLNRDTLHQLAPKLAELTEQVLFADIWQRSELSARDRSLITVAALVALSRTGQLPWHLQLAQQNGLTYQQLVEAITHLAFYAGWPAAVSALEVMPAQQPQDQEPPLCP
ncbi:carboxymuconolactone decarboxylase family protein [Pantoea sp. B65]|uniref:carboxymuconolactone decarboxylase family protein n=1 Tax=Pantoea sp. B65 TaxID=2813359 RepID=UPI0039B52EF1